jgi:Cytochrome c3
LAQQMTSKYAKKEVFLPGKTTDGHYQIELVCDACHTEKFTDADDFQTACLKCHEKELEEAHDSHPKSKFTDPRHAERVALLDARNCITCHTEHQPERTSRMGLSLPEDYCYQCHQDIAQDRVSHAGMTFDSCADAGCHNFHDNRALYEDYLVGRATQPPVLATAFRDIATSQPCPSPLRAGSNDAAAVSSCKQCHAAQTNSWQSGRHGMRLLVGQAPLRPEQSRLPMKQRARGQELSCGSCHGGDPSSAQPKAVTSNAFTEIESCLACHNDKHSLAYKSSRHYELYVQEQSKKVARGSGVTCATCHLPRAVDDDGASFVNHNQNHNLRPNEKMVRSVCEQCHGLSFTLDALADVTLISSNFTGLPSNHVKSVDLAVTRK